MADFSWMHLSMIAIFTAGYLTIIFEYNFKINKTAAALLMAVIGWAILFVHSGKPLDLNIGSLGEHVGNVSQIIFFLLGAMTLVELIDSHRGFKIITDVINTRSKKKMLWLISFISFFLSAVLDNLTTTIVMISLLRKLVPDRKERFLLGSMVVVAANAGGAWTPIGDVTTTMLWIGGQITTLAIIKSLFIPSLVSMLITLLLLGRELKGRYPKLIQEKKETIEPGARLVFFSGIGALIGVPVIKATIGLPPFMGMLVGLGALWLITDLLHHPYENRHHLRVPHVLTRIDTSGVLFFLGILLAINALETVGILKQIAVFLGEKIDSIPLISTVIGLVSAVVDNVPLVAAAMGMYDIQAFPVDGELWQMIAFCAGTGGSILIIGSAAGVALMGIEKIDFIWYLKKISFKALIGYLGGVVCYIFLRMLIPALF
jgi:NhaD family Na+/H+ antiporter